MRELHLIDLHIISSIIAICALIPIFFIKKGGRGHIFLGRVYTIFSFITIGVILTSYIYYFSSRYLEGMYLRYSTGRVSVMIQIVLYLAELGVGLLFVQKENWFSSLKNQKVFMGINLVGILTSLLLLYSLYIHKSTLSAAFCGVVLLNHVVLFIFGLFIFEICKRNPEVTKEGFRVIHASQITSSAILFLFMGIAGTLGNIIFDMDLKFNMNMTLVFPVLDVLMFAWFMRNHSKLMALGLKKE